MKEIPLLQAEHVDGPVGLANHEGHDRPLPERLQPVPDPLRTRQVGHLSNEERAEAEAELRQREVEHRRLAMVASLTSNLVIVTDRRGCIAWVNDAFARETGHTPDDIKGAFVFRLLSGPQTERSRLREIITVLSRGDAVTGLQLVIHASDGRPIRVALEVQQVRDGKGRIAQLVAIASDITEQHRAQAQLLVSEAKFAAAFYGSPDATLVSRFADGVFIEANEAAVVLSGHPREQLVGANALDLHLWDDPTRQEELHRRLTRDRRVADFEARLLTASGELRDALLHASLIEVDGETCQLTIIKDVTASRQAERALRDSEQRLRAVFDSAVDAIVVIDEHGLIEAVNPACERMFGYRVVELIGQSVSRLMPETQRAAHEQHIEGRRRGMPSRVMGLERELVAQRRDGSRFPVEIVLADINDSRGRRVSGTIRDISRRKSAEAAATRLNQELAASVAELERLNRDNAVLSEFRDLLQTCQTVDEVVQISTQFARRLLVDTVGALYLFDTARGLLEEAASWGDALACEPVFTRDDCWALRRGRTFEHTSRDGGVNCDHVRGVVPLTYACVPLMAQGETLGTLYVQALTPAGHGVSALDRRVPTALAEYLSLAIVNVRMRETLRRQATRDPLTQLFNRRYMDEVFERELRRAQRHGRELGVVLLDIDHFKRINDTFGHDAGDHVLTEVALILQRSVRGEDFAFRYGGEEFLLLLPEAAVASVGTRATEIASRIRTTSFTRGCQSLAAVTISAGVASYPSHGTTIGELIRAADKALMQAKAGGRDRVVIAETREA